MVNCYCRICTWQRELCTYFSAGDTDDAKKSPTKKLEKRELESASNFSVPSKKAKLLRSPTSDSDAKLLAYRPDFENKKTELDSPQPEKQDVLFSDIEFFCPGHTQLWSVSLIQEEANGVSERTGQKAIYVQQGSYGVDCEDMPMGPTGNVGVKSQNEVPPEIYYPPPEATAVVQADPETRLDEWRELLGLDYSTKLLASQQAPWGDDCFSLDR